jgi:dolichyl-phosphate-mannose--protein O-mannosyl transferase
MKDFKSQMSAALITQSVGAKFALKGNVKDVKNSFNTEFLHCNKAVYHSSNPFDPFHLLSLISCILMYTWDSLKNLLFFLSNCFYLAAFIRVIVHVFIYLCFTKIKTKGLYSK